MPISFKTTVIVLLVLIAGGFYYSGTYKPRKIRAQCYSEAEFDQRAVLEFDDGKRAAFIDSYHKNCLLRFGLDVESPRIH